MKKILIGLFVIVCVVAVGYNAYRSEQQAATGKKKIYALLPVTGNLSFQGKEEKKAMELWMQNHPDAPFELEIFDNESDATKSLTLAQRIAMSDKQPLFICPTGGMGHPIIPQLKSMNGFMILSPSTQEEDGTYKEFQRISWGASDMNKPLFDYVKKGQNVIIMHSNELAGHTGADKAQEAFEKNGANIIERLAFDTKELDMRIIVLKAISYKPDVIFITSPPTIGFINVIKELKTQEYPGVVLSDPALSMPPIISQLGSNADGFYTTVIPTERIYEEYPQVAKAITEGGMELYWFSINIWDIMDVLNYFVTNNIPFNQNEFMKMKKWHGISSDIVFTENGNSVYTSITLSVVKDGKFVPLEKEER